MALPIQGTPTLDREETKRFMKWVCDNEGKVVHEVVSLEQIRASQAKIREFHARSKKKCD